jgi:putative peptide zinc metalloprotease protein
VAESLFSPFWHRVSELRPRLRAGVRLQQQPYRGEIWYLLVEDANGHQHRINAPAYEFIGRFDGRASVNELWHLLLEKFGDRAPGQEEIVQTLVRLAEGELIQLDAAIALEGIVRRRAERSRRRRAWVNPLAFSVPLVDPARWLARLDPLAGAVVSGPALAAWAVLVAAAALAAAVNWPLLRAHAEHFASAQYLVMAWIAYPVIKALHELGHALAVRRLGGEVHVLGVTFFCFVPAPYVDASAAGGFRRRGERAVVSAIGIMTELALGAAALFVWLAVEAGAVSDVAFVVLGLCLASSLLFNANPLLRFDGYHLLCDVLDAPNLAARSRAWWLQLLRTLLGGDEAGSVPLGRGEQKWLLAYAPLSFAYRLALGAALALWIGEKSSLLGALAGVLLAVFLVVRPAYAAVAGLWRSLPPGARRLRAGALIAASAAALLAALAVLPVPNSIVASGVVWPADNSRVRVDSEGFVAEVLAHDGDTVIPGTPLFVLSEPSLLAERETLQARLQGLSARQYESILRAPAEARNVLEEIESTRGELARIEARIAQWTVRSKAAGRLFVPHAEDLPGSFAQKGATLAYVLTAAPTVVRAAVSQDDASLVRRQVQGIEVRVAGESAPMAARLARDIPAATRVLPSAALGAPGGGEHAVDPKDKEGTLALEPVFLVDVALEGQRIERMGERARVRFDLAAAPLLVQWQRRLRQLLLSHFNPET